MNGLILLPDVCDDVAHAAQWYDEEGGQGLGDRFVACFHLWESRLSQKILRIFQTIVLSDLCPNDWLSFRRIGRKYGLTPSTPSTNK